MCAFVRACVSVFWFIWEDCDDYGVFVCVSASVCMCECVCVCVCYGIRVGTV